TRTARRRRARRRTARHRWTASHQLHGARGQVTLLDGVGAGVQEPARAVQVVADDEPPVLDPGQEEAAELQEVDDLDVPSGRLQLGLELLERGARRRWSVHL